MQKKKRRISVLHTVPLGPLLFCFVLSELSLIHPSTGERGAREIERQREGEREREMHFPVCNSKRERERERERERDLEKGMWIPVCFCERET